MGARVTRRLGQATAALLVASALTACGGGGGGGAGGSDSTLTVAWTTTPEQLDPNVFTGLTWIYTLDASMATLFEVDTSVPDDELITTEDVVPALAEDYEVSEDGTEYTVTLRQGVESPWGNEMTADDVVWSFDRMVSDPTTLQRGVLLAVANFDLDKPVEKVDEYTVKFTLNAPTSVALSTLAYPGLGILDSTEAKKNATADDPWASAWLAKNLNGFGPYMLESLDPGSEVRLTKNPNYEGDDATFTDIVIRAVPDAASRAQLISSGEVDVISEPPIDQLETIDASGNARISNMPDTNRHNLTLSEKSEELSNPLVRQAVNRAINRDNIVSSVYQGFAEPALTPVSSTLWDDQPDVGTYDVDEAKSLLAEAGYADGFDMTLTYSNERPGPYAENLARLIQSDLGAIGINVELQAVPSVADFEAGVSDQSYAAYLYSERPAQPEVGYDLFLYLHSQSALNKSGYANPEFDAVVDEILDSEPGPERDAQIDEAIGILAENDPLVSLVEVPDLAGVAESIDGFSALPSGGVPFQDLSRK